MITGRHYFQNQAGFDKQILSYVYICLLLAEVSLQLKILPRNIYKNKCREDEIDTIFNSPCLFTSNALIQFKSPMLVYEEYFNAGVSIYISHITIFTFATCTQSILLEALSNVTIAILNCNTL